MLYPDRLKTGEVNCVLSVSIGIFNAPSASARIKFDPPGLLKFMVLPSPPFQPCGLILKLAKLVLVPPVEAAVISQLPMPLSKSWDRIPDGGASAFELRLNASPWQTEFKLAAALRPVGLGFILRVCVVVLKHPPGLVTCTEYTVVEPGFTVMDEVVSPPGLHNHDVPVPPVSESVTAASFAHLDKGPVIIADAGCTVIVIMFEYSVLLLVAQVTLNQ